MIDLKTPATAEIPSTVAIAGFVCIGPDGVVFWPSARSTVYESLQACFGQSDAGRLDKLADEGWRCVSIEGGPAAPTIDHLKGAFRAIDNTAMAAILIGKSDGRDCLKSMLTGLRSIRFVVTKTGFREPHVSADDPVP